MKLNILIVFFLLFSLLACKQGTNDKVASNDNWLKGSHNEKFETVAKQLRGFDIAMMETGYRYTELYWAGKDKNWEYANYQLAKIKLTIEHGMERRPLRARSAQPFLQNSIPAMKAAINKKDSSVFNKNFIMFQTACNSCHIAEKVPFIQTGIPEKRLSSINFINQ
jgi:hypothetical protein